MDIYVNFGSGQSGAGTYADPHLVDSQADWDDILDGTYTSHAKGSRLSSSDTVYMLGTDGLNYGAIKLGSVIIPGLTVKAYNKRGVKVTRYWWATYDAWTNGEAISVGDARGNGGKTYVATSAGTTSGTSPLDDTGVSWTDQSLDANYMRFQDIHFDFTASNVRYIGRYEFVNCRVWWNHGGSYAFENNAALKQPWKMYQCDFVVITTYSGGFRQAPSGFEFYNCTIFCDKDSGDDYPWFGGSGYTDRVTSKNCIWAINKDDTANVSTYFGPMFHDDSVNNLMYKGAGSYGHSNIATYTSWPEFADESAGVYDFDPKPSATNQVLNTANGVESPL